MLSHVDGGITAVHQRPLRMTHDNPRRPSDDSTESPAVWVVNHPQRLTLTHNITQTDAELQDPAVGRPHPFRRPRPYGHRRRVRCVVDHAVVRKDPQTAVGAGRDGGGVEPVRLSSLEQQGGRPGIGRGTAE